MILPIHSSISFKEKEVTSEKNNSAEEKDILLKNNVSNRMRIGIDKFTKAFTVYPARGMKGSINSNFYEFLTMGTVPYIIGSLTLMSIFNSANKHFAHEQYKAAAKIGNRMALGVLLYPLFKVISKSFVNLPVKWITGVDTQLPYRQVNNILQENPDDYDLTSYEYHKVGESVEFTRWDLLYGDPKDPKKLNEKYDKIAKKNGLGQNLNDSDQAVKPLYREILTKSSLARNISSYMWAAVGVALAIQKPWDEFFEGMTLKFWKPEFYDSITAFGRSFVRSAKELYSPSGELGKISKHSGKVLLGMAIASTVLGVLNTLHITQKPSKTKESDVISPDKEKV
ncbi:hypothetical protein IJ596_03530, partial [bacterium]|nr:hypothetical protein [bacterium]